MLKIIGKKGLILALFALITTGLIVATFVYTKDTIAEAKQAQLLSVLNELVPKSQHTNALDTDCIVLGASPLLGNKPQRAFRARHINDDVAVLIETTAPDGYSGDIDMVIAIDSSSTILGARVLSHKETPGLGDKIDIRISDWILDFNDVTYAPETASRWKVKKDGGQFDQFTGATITPRAVVKAIAKAANYVSENKDKLFDTPSNCLTNIDNQGAGHE